ncbi:hypothetical protein JRO89_XS12G0153700 [Xanthoceras sorbifolium]|uniref:Uncharacterized protein n=1 Tax=Xanthoceras sorbifolium TaxID=99658 RepID=A0ABQ8HCT1_9ROSI|nr:hypothetical protein JRO89_XS12G0153700 [Xanthoceras sorbifolium]
MEDLIYVKDYYLPVFVEEKPEDKTDAEWNYFIVKYAGTLPDSWETLRSSLSNVAPYGIITMDLAKSNVTDEVQNEQNATWDVDTHTQIEVDDDTHEHSPVSEISPDTGFVTRDSVEQARQEDREPTKGIET